MPDVTTPRLEPRFLEPEGFRWGTFANQRGNLLRWGHLPAPDAPRICILVGGFGEFIEKYFETIRDFSSRGFSVWCLDWQGQGGSARPEPHPTRPVTRDFDADAGDLAQFIETVVAADQIGAPRPRLLVAHSMGAAIALLCLSQRPRVVDAAVLSAPILGLAIGRLPSWLAKLIVHTGLAFGRRGQFVPGAGPGEADPTLCAAKSHTSHDEERCLVQSAWFTARPALRVDGATYGWLASAFSVMDRLVKPDLLARVTLPLAVRAASCSSILAATARRPRCCRIASW